MPSVNERRVSFLGEFGGLGHPVAGHIWREFSQGKVLGEKTGNWGYGGIEDTKTPEGLEKTYLGLMEKLGEFADHTPAVRKKASFIAAVREHCGIEDADPYITHTMYSLEGGAAAAQRLAQRGVTAIACASDVMALGAVRAFQRMGLDVPGDVSVVGFDDSAFMPLVNPPLTTLRQPVEAMGRAAVSLLASRMSGQSDTDEELLFEPELVVRGSTAVLRTR